MTKIRPQDTLNHIFPEKGFFYALALVKYRCCILKIPGLGPVPARQRILVYSKCQGPGWFLLDSVYLYTQISWAASCSAAYTVYSNFQNPGLFLLGSVYLYTRPGPAPDRQLLDAQLYFLL